jgi:hypothetical protein
MSRNMRYLVIAGKHVNSTQAVSRQLLSKQIPAATDAHATVEVLLDYNNGDLLSVRFVPKCYKQKQQVSCQRAVSSSVE